MASITGKETELTVCTLDRLLGSLPLGDIVADPLNTGNPVLFIKYR